jgi:hypothetical protein
MVRPFHFRTGYQAMSRKLDIRLWDSFSWSEYQTSLGFGRWLYKARSFIDIRFNTRSWITNIDGFFILIIQMSVIHTWPVMPFLVLSALVLFPSHPLKKCLLFRSLTCLLLRSRLFFTSPHLLCAQPFNKDSRVLMRTKVCYLHIILFLFSPYTGPCAAFQSSKENNWPRW